MSAGPDRNPAQQHSAAPVVAGETFALVPEGEEARLARVTEAVRVREFFPPAEQVQRGYTIADSPLTGGGHNLVGRLVVDEPRSKPSPPESPKTPAARAAAGSSPHWSPGSAQTCSEPPAAS